MVAPSKIYVVKETSVCTQEHLVLANSEKEVLIKMESGDYYDLDNVPNIQGVVELSTSEIKLDDPLMSEFMFKRAYSKLLEGRKLKGKKEYEPS